MCQKGEKELFMFIVFIISQKHIIYKIIRLIRTLIESITSGGDTRASTKDHTSSIHQLWKLHPLLQIKEEQHQL